MFSDTGSSPSVTTVTSSKVCTISHNYCRDKSVKSQPVMPSILLTNVNRILNKLDELAILVTRGLTIDLLIITETWLDD